MKKILLTRLSLLIFAFLFAAGCRKETTETTALNEEVASLSTDNKSDKRGDCRLTRTHYYDAIHDLVEEEFYSYKNGKLDEWLVFYGYTFKMEYERNGNMKYAKVYMEGTLINTIKFIYRNNKVVKEIWYTGNTTNVEDEVTNTYNRKGELIKSQSIAYDYIVLNTYTNEGNLKSWFYYYAGLPSQKAEYTYGSDYKNPFNARPGLEYTFAYINSAVGSGKNWYSSQKITMYDEEGNPSVFYDQDPRRTTWQPGPKKYPLQINYIDKLTGSPITNTFEYENCSGHHNDSPAGSLSQKQVVNKNKAATANFKSLMHGHQGGIIPKLKKLEK